MSKKDFECTARLRMRQGAAAEVFPALSEAADAVFHRPGVIGTVCRRDGDTAYIDYALHVEDEGEAGLLAESILADVERAAREQFGDTAVEREQLEVEPVVPMSNAVLRELIESAERSATKPADGALGDAPEVPIDDPYRVMREVGLNGGTYELETGEIIAWFKEWEGRARFHFTSIDRAHATVVFEELPDDVEAFAAVAHRFCPDLDNDVEALEELDPDDDEAMDAVAVRGIAENMRRDRRLHFWWD